MSSVDLYDILNVKNDCSIKDIKLAFRKLAKRFHPDSPTGNDEMFELVTNAYNILINPESRKEYDAIYKISKEATTDHFSLKDGALNYYKAQETDVTTLSKKEQKKKWKEDFVMMDKKHGYKRDMDDGVINKKDAMKRFQDLEYARDQEDIENMHEKLFDDGRFDLATFNALFDKMHKQDGDEMIPHSGNPMAWNTLDGQAAVYSAIGDYGDIYTEDDDNFAFDGNNYDNTKFNKQINKASINDLVNLEPADYTKGHNNLDSDYNKMLEERMKDLKTDFNSYDDMKFNDFDTDPSCGGYGIFDDVGIAGRQLSWDNFEDDTKEMQERYNRLLELRDKEIN